MRLKILTLILALCTVTLHAQDLYTMPKGIETRWASPENPTGAKGAAGQANAGRKGRAYVPIKAGESFTLADYQGGSGTVRRIWATIIDRSPAMLRGLKIEMFWDGSTKPAVSAPFGDFFAMGLGHMSTMESAFFASPEGRSFLCFIPMPFKTGMKIVVTNESGKDLKFLFYDVDYTIGDKHTSDDLYFHAHFQHQDPTTLQKDFEVLPHITGRGRYLGASFGVQANRKIYGDNWWGEGEVKAFIDGDQEHPTLNGTGTEDYIGTGWGLKQFSTLYHGAPFVDPATMQYSFYRFHALDPVYFEKEIRVTIQQIGFLEGDNPNDPIYKSGVPLYKTGAGHTPMNKGDRGTFERQDAWSAVSYFYLDQPDDNFPTLESPEQRMKGMSWDKPATTP